MAALFFVLSGTTRFFLEFLRGDPRGGTSALATSQWIAIGFVLVGVVMWVFASARGAPTGAAPVTP